MKARKNIIIAALPVSLTIGILTGCAVDAESTGELSSGSRQERSPSSQPTLDGHDPESMARKTLSHFLSVAAEDLKLVSLAAVNWPDASLGCPQPGMNYAQVITPGYDAVFVHDRHTYHVHMANGRVLVCKNPSDGIGYEIPPQSE